MPRKQGNERALGPYKHGTKWRVVYVAASGAREVESYETEAEAIEARDAARLTAGNRSVMDAIGEYLKEHAECRGVETMRYRLRSLLRVKDGDRPLVSLTAAVARDLYAKRTTEVKPDTHHGELRYARQFCGWCVKRGYLRIDPFAGIETVGKKSKGKPKLRVNESRTFLAMLLADESVEATAVLTAFLLGMRATSVVERTVEDLDDGGRLFWITKDKTKSGEREIEIPEVLSERLLKLAEGKAPTDRLFGDVDRHWLLRATVRYCKAAGVKRVTPHGLRGSGATSAVRMGGSVEDVARALGHADRGATARAHYIGGGAEESARGRRIEGLILGTKPDRIVPKEGSERN